VARGRELRALRAAFTSAAGGTATAVLLSGDAGVGKTRMAEELAEAARADGALVLTGRCLDSGETGLPYLPVVEALGPVRERAGSRAALARLFGDWVELGLPDAGLSAAATGAPRVEQDINQLQLFDAVHALLAELTAERPVLLVLEDLHWADASTRRLVSFLLSRLRGQRLLVLATYRGEDLHRRHPLRPLLAELLRLPAVERLDLAPFNRADARSFVSALSEGGLGDAAVRDLAERSDGNAFFAEELFAAYSDCGDRGDALPATLVDVLLARIERLGPAAQNAVRLASVGGRRVPDARLRAVAGIDGADLDTALREAVQHNVLVTEHADVYTFRHALLREAVYHDLLPGERVRLHAAYAQELGARIGEPGVAAALAHHSMESHALPVALRASLEAASEAERLGAPAESLEHLERALKIWDAVPVEQRPDRSNARLLERASFVAGTSGEPERAIAYAKAAVTCVDAAAEPEQAAHVRRRLAQALYATDGREEEAGLVIEAALELVADRPGAVAAWVHAANATILRGLGRPVESADHARAALAQAKAADAGGAEADALITLAMLDETAGQVADAREGLRAAMDLATRVGAPTVEIRARFTLALNQYEHGDLAEAVHTLAEGVARAAEHGLTWSTYGLELRALSLVCQYASGDWDAADAAAEPGHRVSHVVWGRLTMLGALISVGRGRFPEADRVLAEFRTEDHRTTPTPLVAAIVAAELALWRGKPDRALEQLRSCLADTGSGWEMMAIRLAALALAAAAEVAHTATSRRDEDTVKSVTAEADTLITLARDTATKGAPRTGDLGPEGRAWLARAEAEHARVHGTPDPALWHRAVEAFDYGAVYEQAICRWRLAESLLHTDDRPSAADHLRQAAATATTLGAKPLQDATTRTARRARISLDPDATPRERVDLFTPRERAVLALVAKGRTNRQVGEELFISEKTVSVHLSRIMSKLGAIRRAEAVAVAYDRGLLEKPSEG
jgi:ATP/maltotriose-dependent transcriptional regulator MalT